MNGWPALRDFAPRLDLRPSLAIKRSGAPGIRFQNRPPTHIVKAFGGVDHNRSDGCAADPSP